MKLYELAQAYRQIQDMSEELDEQTLRDTLESIEGEIEDKVENTAKLIKSMEADTEAIKAEEKRLADRRKALENKISSLKQYIKEQMELTGLKQVKRPLITVSVRNTPPAVNVVDESLIPSEYIITQPGKLSTKDIKEALKSGVEVPGAELITGKGLAIK